MTKRRLERRDPEATRQALLRSGAEMFAELGYDGVRVEALARKAGVNKAMINYHFGGKRKLYEAITQQAFAELAARVRELRSSGQPPREQLRAFIDGFAELATTRLPNFPALVVREVIAANRQPSMLPRMKEVVVGMCEVIERGVRDGSFRKVEPMAAYMNLIGGLALFFATEPVRRHAFKTGGLSRPPTADAYIRYVQELMQRGLERPSRSSRPRGASA